MCSGNDNDNKRKKEEIKQIYKEPRPEIINMGPNLRKSPLICPPSQNFNSGNTGAQKSVLGWEAVKPSSSCVKNDWGNVAADPPGREVSAPEGRQKQT